MTATQNEYFVIDAELNDSHPLLQWDEEVWGFGRPKPVAISHPVRLCLGAPVPRNPVMVDHRALPQPVFSTRIMEVLEPLERRLLFVLEESISTYVFHRSLVERMLALPPPEGLRFIRVDSWNDSAGFHAEAAP